jgi:hypothetical protein
LCTRIPKYEGVFIATRALLHFPSDVPQNEKLTKLS